MSVDGVHGYFLNRARAVFVNAGGDPENAGPLAAWAQRVRPGNDHWLRAVVAETGEILAEAQYLGRNRPVPAAYISWVAHESDRDLVGLEMGLARGQFGRRHETRAIVVTFSDVCLGQGVRSE